MRTFLWCVHAYAHVYAHFQCFPTLFERGTRRKSVWPIYREQLVESRRRPVPVPCRKMLDAQNAHFRWKAATSTAAATATASSGRCYVRTAR